MDEGTASARPESALSGTFVGRDEEMAALAAVWAEAREADALRVAAVVGRPGSGRSRLVQEVLVELDVPSWTVRCSAPGEVLGVEGLMQLLTTLCAADGEGLPARLAALLPEDPVLVARLLGHVELAPGVAGRDELPGDVGLLLRKLLAGTAAVLVLDDLDESTPWFRGVLAGALSGCRDLPLVVLATTQDSSALAPLVLDRLVELAPLGSAQVAELLVAALGGSPVVEQLAVPVARAAHGSPLLLEQLLALLVDDGSLRGGADGWQLERLPAAPAEGLDRVVAARLAQLSLAERRVLECAAVLGDAVGVGELLALSAGGQDPSVSLHTLVARHLLRPVDDGQAYRFHHPALQQAVHRGTPKRRLSELHLRAADHLEHVAPGGRERIAVHLEQAVRLHTHLEPAVLVEPLARRAAQAWHELGRRALLHDEPAGARECLERGLSVAPLGSTERPGLLQALGEAQLALGQAKAAVRLSQEAAALAESAGNEAVRLLADLCRLHAESVLGAVPASAALGPMRASATRLEARREWGRTPRAWLAVAEVAQEACDWEAAAAAATRAARRARETSSPDLGLCLVRSSTVAALGPTPVAEAREVCRDALHQAPAETVASALCTANAAFVAALDGRDQEAQELNDYALDVARWRGSPGALGEVLLTGARAALAEGRDRDAIPLLSEAQQVLHPHGLPWGVPSAYEALARVRVGDVDGARVVRARTPVPGGDPVVLGLHDLEQQVAASLVDALLLGGADPMASVASAHAAVRVAERTGVPLLRAEALRVLAEALTRVEAADDARQARDAARELCLAKGAHVLVAQLSVDLAAH